MIDEKVLIQIRALVLKSLEGSGCTEEERRTSAVIACRLIHEHKLIPASPPPGREREQSPPPSPTGTYPSGTQTGQTCSVCGGAKIYLRGLPICPVCMFRNMAGDVGRAQAQARRKRICRGCGASIDWNARDGFCSDCASVQENGVAVSCFRCPNHGPIRASNLAAVIAAKAAGFRKMKGRDDALCPACVAKDPAAVVE